MLEKEHSRQNEPHEDPTVLRRLVRIRENSVEPAGLVAYIVSHKNIDTVGMYGEAGGGKTTVMDELAQELENFGFHVGRLKWGDVVAEFEQYVGKHRNLWTKEEAKIWYPELSHYFYHRIVHFPRLTPEELNGKRQVLLFEGSFMGTEKDRGMTALQNFAADIRMRRKMQLPQNVLLLGAIADFRSQEVATIQRWDVDRATDAEILSLLREKYHVIIHTDLADEYEIVRQVRSRVKNSAPVRHIWGIAREGYSIEQVRQTMVRLRRYTFPVPQGLYGRDEYSFKFRLVEMRRRHRRAKLGKTPYAWIIFNQYDEHLPIHWHI